jgi:hypothetical protein
MNQDDILNVILALFDTIWGGAISEDRIAGIVVSQGSADATPT